MKTIAVYEDYVFNKGMLLKSLEGYHYALLDSQDIISGTLSGTFDALIMPGGADLYFCEKLNGRANRIITSYVENGGNYIGLCAGAYYGCHAIEWAKDEGTEAVIGTRELAFYSGKAVGPIYQYIEERDFSKSWDGCAQIQFQSEDPLTVWYAGGPMFEEPSHANERVRARYADLPGKPPAIVHIEVGKGRAILAGPHIEVNADLYKNKITGHANPAYDRQQTVLAELTKDTVKQRRLWRELLESL
ncbi:MAG: BPL-N domain-containing protein [Spirochaetales bacterium]|nr:BPL-N domain-containing protein [Spirochaetales bacterium]